MYGLFTNSIATCDLTSWAQFCFFAILLNFVYRFHTWNFITIPIQKLSQTLYTNVSSKNSVQLFAICKLNHSSRSYETIFLCLQRISLFFAAKLGLFTISYFFICVTKHTNLTAKIRKWRKKSFLGSATGQSWTKRTYSVGKIDSGIHFQYQY